MSPDVYGYVDMIGYADVVGYDEACESTYFLKISRMPLSARFWLMR